MVEKCEEKSGVVSSAEPRRTRPTPNNAVVTHLGASERSPVTAQDLRGMNRGRDMTEHKPVSSLVASFYKSTVITLRAPVAAKYHLNRHNLRSGLLLQ